MLFLEIIVFCVEGELRNLWKKSQQGSFRNVRTSVEVENCFAVKFSSSQLYRSLRKMQKGSHTYKRTGQTFHYVSIDSNIIIFLGVLCGRLCPIDFILRIGIHALKVN